MTESPLITRNEVYVGKASAGFHKKDKGRIKDAGVANAAAQNIKRLWDEKRKGQVNSDSPAEKIFFSQQMTDAALIATAENVIKDQKIIEASELSIKDPLLTELHNRRFFDETLQLALAGDKRDKVPTGLVIGDLQTLKILNDQYGHLVGDTVLKSIQDSLNSGFRNDDVKCRIGGDEFGIIMPNVATREYDVHKTPAEALADAALRVAQHVNEQRVSTRTETDENISPIIDFGVSLSSVDDTYESIMNRTDCATYLAKYLHKNGNRKISIVMATEFQGRTEYKHVYFDEEKNIIFENISDAEVLINQRKSK